MKRSFLFLAVLLAFFGVAMTGCSCDDCGDPCNTCATPCSPCGDTGGYQTMPPPPPPPPATR